MAKFIPMKKFADSRGWSLNDIYSMIPQRPIKEFNYQVNYSLMYPGVIKAWHRHEHQDDFFCILTGMAQIGVYSDENGPEKFFIGEHNPGIVHIKRGEWHGLTALGNQPCGLLYFVTNKYDPENPDEERAGAFEFVEPSWWLPENK